MFDLNHLSHFLAVVRHGHFHRAAAEIHLSQSALSRSIQALERAVGKPLLIRSRGRVELSTHGKIVARHAEVLLRERQRLLDDLARDEHQSEGSISIGLGLFAAEQAGIEAAVSLTGKDGRLLCQLRIGDYRQIQSDLLSRRVDLGYCDLSLARQDSRFDCKPNCRTQLYCYTRPDHPLTRLRDHKPADLFSYPYIGSRAPLHVDVARLSRNPMADGLTGELLPTLNTASPTLALKLLCNSDAVAFASLGMIETLLAEGRVGLIPLRVDSLSLDHGFIHLKERTPDALALRYIDALASLEARAAEHNQKLEARYGVDQP